MWTKLTLHYVKCQSTDRVQYTIDIVNTTLSLNMNGAKLGEVRKSDLTRHIIFYVCDFLMVWSKHRQPFAL